MMPGTERAIIALVEGKLPQLSKAIEALTEAMKAKAPQTPNGRMTATLTLTPEQWVELTSAIASKATNVEQGNYGEADDIDGFDPKKWAEDLKELHDEVARSLMAQGIPQ